jgi:hypothetical protein
VRVQSARVIFANVCFAPPPWNSLHTAAYVTFPTTQVSKLLIIQRAIKEKMVSIDLIIGASFFVPLKNFYTGNIAAGKALYPNINELVVKGEIIQEEEGTFACNFPAILRVFKLHEDFFKSKSVLSVPKSSQKILTLKMHCKAEKVNIFRKCEAYQGELVKMKAFGVKLMPKLKKINSKGSKTPKAIKNSMLTCVREHLLHPVQHRRLEVLRKSFLGSLGVIADSGSQCLYLNQLCSLIGCKIKGPMHNRFRTTGDVPSRGLYAPLPFVDKVFSKYLLITGFSEVDNAVCRKGLYRYKTQELAVVEKAFGGSQNSASGRDPFLFVTCVRSDEGWANMKVIAGMENAPVVRDPRSGNVTVQDLRDSLLFEMGDVVDQDDLIGWSKGKLIDALLKHRIASKSYLGLSSYSGLIVDDMNPFCINISPTSNGQCIIKFSFKVFRNKVIFTLNQETVVERMY